MDQNQLNDVLKEAECLANEAKVTAAFDQMASKINHDLNGCNPVVLCVMTGGIIPTGHLVTRLNMNLQLDYIHATRYQGQTKGGALNWLRTPEVSLDGRVVLIIDDIFDEGITLSEIVNYCIEHGSKKVYTAVLVNKVHDRKTTLNIDYIGLNIEDRYLFGCGMDYHEYFRNIFAIYAVKGM